MRKWKSTCIAVSVAAALLIPAVVTANETHDYGKFHRDRGGDHIHAKYVDFMLERVHRQYYFTLLSDKYTPESTKEWKEVFAERERLMKEIKMLHGEVGKTARSGRTEEEKQARREEMKNRHEQKAALYEEFTEAVRSQDQTKIKAVLPKLLEQTKQVNKHIAERIAAMKKK